MTGEQLRRWRRARKLTQIQLARRLRISERRIRALEGDRSCRSHSVPKLVELACYAVDNGVFAFDGGAVRT